MLALRHHVLACLDNPTCIVSLRPYLTGIVDNVITAYSLRYTTQSRAATNKKEPSSDKFSSDGSFSAGLNALFQG